jgi:autotransporter-associated beta strand protein
LYWDGNGTTAGAGNTTALLNREWGTFAAWNSDAAGVTDTFTATTTATDDLFFVAAPSATSGNITFNPTVLGSQQASSITFQQAGSMTLSGGTSIMLNSATGLNFSNGTGANTISTPLILGASSTFTNSDNSLQTISGGLTGAFDLTLKADSTGGFTFSTSSVNNQGTITNSGAGANTVTISAVVGANVSGVRQNSAASLLILSGANTTYAGTTTLTQGTLRGANTATTDVLNAFGTGALMLNGGTLQLKANGSGSTKTIVAGNAVTIGASPVTIDVNNNGANTGSTITLGNLSLGSGQLNVTGGNTYALRFTGSTTLTANATINPTTANVSLVGAIDDGGSGFGITKIGTGTLSLTGTNTYTGVTSILGGTVSLGSAAPSGSAGALGNATSAILLGDTSGSVNASLAEGTFVVGRDIIVQSGNTGTMTLGSASQGNTSSSYTGTITLGSAGGTGHGLTLAPTNFHTTAVSGVIQDPAGLVGPAAALTIAAGASSSTVSLSATNTYTGGTVLNTGTLRIAGLQALGLGSLTINGGAVAQSIAGAIVGLTSQTWAGNFNFSATSGAINLGISPVNVIGARSISVDNGAVTIGGVISGAGASLRFNSTNFTSSVTLNGANTFDGGLTIAQSGTANITIVSGSATALGTGQVRLTNAAGSKLSLSADTTVDSLTSGIAAATTIVGGTGGTSGTYPLVFTGGGGSGAAGTATVSGGAITAVTLTDLGTNYTSAPTITLSGGDGTGTVTSNFGSSSIALNARTLTVAGTNASPATYAGIISGTGSFIKNGSGTQALSGSSTYSGATTVNNGTLSISGTLNGTSAVNINGGVLEIGADERLSNSASVIMSGGTLRTAGFTESLGTLTLSGPATIDLGSGASTLDFFDSSSLSWTGSLSIMNWSGSTEGGGIDQLLFGNSDTALRADQIAMIHFVDPAGFAPGTYDATILINGEVVAVPEPTSAMMLCSGLGLLLAFRSAKRRRAMA